MSRPSKLVIMSVSTSKTVIILYIIYLSNNHADTSIIAIYNIHYRVECIVMIPKMYKRTQDLDYIIFQWDLNWFYKTHRDNSLHFPSLNLECPSVHPIKRKNIDMFLSSSRWHIACSHQLKNCSLGTKQSLTHSKLNMQSNFYIKATQGNLKMWPLI
jgi:hypothetical protein